MEKGAVVKNIDTVRFLWGWGGGVQFIDYCLAC